MPVARVSMAKVVMMKIVSAIFHVKHRFLPVMPNWKTAVPTVFQSGRIVIQKLDLPAANIAPRILNHHIF